MPTPSAFSGLSASNRRCTSSAGSDAEGSSRTRTSASTLKARAMATSDFSVRERSRTRMAGRERDVLGDRHPFDEAEVLVDERHGLRLAEPRRTMAVGFAAIFDGAFGRLDDAAKRLDEGGLAGAVLAEESENLARVKIERDAAQRQNAAEPLDEIGETDERTLGASRRGHFLSVLDPSVRRMAVQISGRCYR